jgi:heavy metal translocating P-type ATPase
MLIIDVRSPQSESVGTYFDSCVFLIMFILLGRTLEAYAKSRTTDAVSLLGSLRPATAFLVDEQSWNLHEKALSSPDLVVHDIGTSSPPYPTAPREVPVEQLEKGDLVLIPPGALPPTDGVIVSGSTTFDEASLTGESMPVPKTVGDEVFTGTNNLSGAVTIRVIKLGGETMLSKIIAAVSDASAKKAPIEKLAERLTGVFVPVIVYLSIIILAIWLGVVLSDHVNVANRNGGEVFFAIEFAISVLVVACPCGIGLAVPCANAVGNGIAARAGILAAGGGEAFLAATRVTTVAFDKTGTLTVGKSVMTAEKYLPDSSDSSRVENVKAVVQAVEIGSTHPLAKGLAECLAESTSRTMPVEVLSSNEVSGRGLIAKVKVADNSLDVLIGNLSLMHQHAVHVPPAMLDLLKTWSNQAKSVVLVALRREDESPFNLRAMYALSDRPRAEAADVIGQLKAKGIRVVMLSGDNGRTANAVAGIVGIRQEDVWADVGPQGKATVIRELQARPRAGRLPPSLVERARRSFGGRPKDIKEVVMFIGGELNFSESSSKPNGVLNDIQMV